MAKLSHSLRIGLLLVVVFVMVTVPIGAQASVWQTGLNFQNLSFGPEDTATLQVEFFDGTGTVVATVERTGILPGAGASIYVPGESSVPYGLFSGVVSSNQPLAAVVNNVNRTDFVGDSYLGTRDVEVSQIVYAPLVYRNFNGYVTTLYVQNVHSLAQQVSVSLTRSGEASPAVTQTYGIPAYASMEISLADSAYAVFGASAHGAATIEGADGPVAVVVSYFRNPVAGTLDNIVGQYRGLSRESAATEIYAPLVFKRHSLWDSGISVVNVTDLPTTVTVELYASAQSVHAGTVVTLTDTLDPKGAGSFYLPSLAQIPSPGFFGAARITSDQDILVIVNNVKYPPGTHSVGSCYAPVTLAEATDTVAGPLVYRNFGDADTGINVQNLGTTGTDIHLKFTAENLPGIVYEFDLLGIPAGGSGTFYLPALIPAVPGMHGSALVTTSSGNPLAVVFNAPAYARGLSANYVGINVVKP